MPRILISLGTIAAAGSIMLVGATGAFFSDTETSEGNTFTAGAIDLTIDNESYYNGLLNEGTSWEATDLTDEKFFNFSDLKPDDYGEDTISIHVATNDAFLCADITLTSNEENGQTEPEAQVDETIGEGELAGLVEFVAWADDGDNVLENDEDLLIDDIGPIGALPIGQPFSLTLADSDKNVWENGSGPIDGNETYFIGKAWCFGDLTLAELTQDDYDSPAGDNDDNGTPGEPEDGGFSCDGSNLGNESQTDTLTASVSFEAIQARHNEDFQCEEPPEIVIEECEVPTLAYADTVVNFDQGLRKNGTAVLPERSNPSYALGAPETTGTPSDAVVTPNTFFSLGFDEDGNDTEGGWIVVEFEDNVIVDGAGDDLQVWEVTGGSYPDEHVKIEVSQNGSTWYTVAADLTRDAQADLASSGLDWAKYIRLTDVTLPGPFEATADAYDLDAFSALNCGVIAQ